MKETHTQAACLIQSGRELANPILVLNRNLRCFIHQFAITVPGGILKDFDAVATNK
jgi:hypothetical protein